MLIIYNGYRKGFLRGEVWSYSRSMQPTSVHMYGEKAPIENSRQMFKEIKRKQQTLNDKL